jgi:hypothetical protein
MRARFVAFVIGFLVLSLVCLGAWSLFATLRRDEGDPRRSISPLGNSGPRVAMDSSKKPEAPLGMLTFDPGYWPDEDDDWHKEQARINEQLARGERGNSGRAGSTGRGIGRGFPSNPSLRRLRQARWSIMLPRENSEAYIKKLTELKAFVVIPEGGGSSSFLLCEDLTQRPAEWTKVSAEEIEKNNLMWLFSTEVRDRGCIAEGLQRTKTPRWIAIFVPQELEKVMDDVEWKHKNLSEKELNDKWWTTNFEVDRRGDMWDVRVRYQGPHK